MGISLQSKLKILRADYSQVTGSLFTYFYCPILFNDESVPLCKGHIVNRRFPNSAQDWTVQRKDVDNFFGSNFEADFLSLLYHEDGSAEKALTHKGLSRRLKPKILLDDKPVDYFIPGNDLPNHFTRIEFEHKGQVTPLGLKMRPQDVLSSLDKKWEIEIKKDLRIHSVVSLIKAAHLTLFEMLGYRYVLSRAGYLVGRRILGEFFYQNRNKSKSEVLLAAEPLFRKFIQLVRPLQANSLKLEGTITDKRLFICGGSSGIPWAFIVFVRTSRLLSAVMIPLLDTPAAVKVFTGFLQDNNETIDATFCRFDGGKWIMNREPMELIWPKRGIDFA